MPFLHCFGDWAGTHGYIVWFMASFGWMGMDGWGLFGDDTSRACGVVVVVS